MIKKNSKDINISINVALENAKKRINLLKDANRECVIEEYREWINEGLNYKTILFLREDPII